jgi:plasmid stability protein
MRVMVSPFSCLGVIASIWKPTVPSLLIRNIDKTLHARLKERAATHRRSPEEEARELLRWAVALQPRDENIVDVARRLFGPKHGFDLVIPPRGSAPERLPPDLTKLDGHA